MKYVCYCDTPVGRMGLLEENDRLAAVFFAGSITPVGAEETNTPLLEKTKVQLDEYFTGKRQSFDLPLEPAGTDFEKQVWDALLDIPYGQTRSYADVAAAIGKPKACRAVGRANSRNPIAIIVPCHRVIGSSGTLTGYAGGLNKKEALLRHEGIIL